MKTTHSSTSALSLGFACALALTQTTAPANQIWEHRYDGPGHGDDRANAIAVDSPGNVIVTGSSMNQNGDNDFYTAKYAAGDGQLLWERRTNGPAGGDDRGTGVAVDRDGNVIVTGYSFSPPGLNASAQYEFYTVKYAGADGSIMWDRRGPPAPNNACCVADADQIKRVAVDSEGNVVVSGVSVFLGYWRGYYTVKYAGSDGHTLWEQRYAGPGYLSGSMAGDLPAGLAIDRDGNVVVTGRSACGCNQTSVDRFEFLTIKYAADDGRELWQQRSTDNLHDAPAGVAIDGAGNVAVTGTSRVPGGAPMLGYYTVKYSTGGDLLWEQRYQGPAHGNDQARGVAMDNAGNVIVTGESQGASGCYGFYTAKYAAANGDLQWAQSYEGCACAAGGIGVAVDSSNSSGDVVVTGGVSGGGFDYYSVKYAAANGEVIWKERSSPANTSGPAAMVLDNAGNIIVTGPSQNDQGNLDYYTVKYSTTSISPPTISCPGNMVVSADPGQCLAVVSFTVTATDNDCNTYPVTCSPPSGSAFAMGLTTVTCIAGSQNKASCSFTVTVTGDTTKPTIACPANIVVHPPCGQSSTVVNYATPQASDNCSGVTVTCDPPSGSRFPAGTTTVNCTARDASGNEAFCSLTVTVDTSASTFQFNGFLSPIGGADGTGGSFADPIRTFKLKSIIPVKFKASCDGSPVLTGVHTLQPIKYSSETTGDTPIDATPSDGATTGDQFRLSGEEWHFNLDTQATGMSAGIWLLRATLSDGSQHSAWIQIK